MDDDYILDRTNDILRKRLSLGLTAGGASKKKKTKKRSPCQVGSTYRCVDALGTITLNKKEYMAEKKHQAELNKILDIDDNEIYASAFSKLPKLYYARIQKTLPDGSTGIESVYKINGIKVSKQEFERGLEKEKAIKKSISDKIGNIPKPIKFKPPQGDDFEIDFDIEGLGLSAGCQMCGGCCGQGCMMCGGEGVIYGGGRRRKRCPTGSNRKKRVGCVIRNTKTKKRCPKGSTKRKRVGCVIDNTRRKNTTTRKKQSPWNKHLKAYMRSHPNLSLAEAAHQAKNSY